MARDSSPFAQRLKALRGRPGRPADAVADSPASAGAAGPDLPEPQSGAPDPTEAPAAEGVAAAADPTPPDEQPTGEFPAVDEPADAVESDPVAQPASETDGTAAPSEPEPFQYEPPATMAEASPSGPDPAPPVSSWPVPPPIKPGMSPWLEPEEAGGLQPDASESPQPQPAASPIWLDPPPYEQVPPSGVPEDAPSPSSDSAYETFAPASPAPDDAYDAPAEDPGEIAPSDGPTLAPPDLSVRPAADDRSPAPASTDEAPDTSAAATAAEPEYSTPAALDAAMALPSDEDAADSDADLGRTATADDESQPGTSGTSTPTIALEQASPRDGDQAAGEDSAPGDTEREDGPSESSSTTDDDATPRRGFLGRLRSRTAAPTAPAEAAPLEGAEEPGPVDDTKSGSIADTVATSASSTRASEGTHEASRQGVIESETSQDSPADGATSEWSIRETSPETPDPGSITGRFSAIGRRAKALASRSPATETAPAAQAEPAPSATPAVEHAEPTRAVVDDDAPEAPKPSFAERSALRRRVKTLRARRDAGLVELGAIVVDQSRFGDPTGGTLVRRRARDLGDLDTEIASIEDVLDADRSASAVAQLGVVHCTNCSALVGPEDGFCAQCGTPRASAGAAGGTANAS